MDTSVTKGCEIEKYSGRILCLTSTFPRWEGDSTPPFVLHLAQDLQALGWEVDVLAPHAPGSKTSEMIEGVKVQRFRYLWPETQETLCYGGGALINLRKNPLNWVKLPLLIFFEWLALIRYLNSGRYELLHTHWVLPQGLVGVLVAPFLNIPHVITVHGSDVFRLRGRLFTLLKRFSFKRATAVTVNSSATGKAAVGSSQGPDNFHLIPMGATLRSHVSDPSPLHVRNRYRRGNGPLLAYVGRVIEEKGVEDILQAILSVREGMPEITAIIIGDGQDRKRLEETAKNLGIAERVTFLGWIPQEVIPNY